jgi:NAD(P)-dependent dehydrogenase (short-subunit alcohol dehydrogenase family)
MWLEHARPGLAAYATGKMAAFGLMLVVAVEGEAYGIRANAVSPVAATRMLQRETEARELAPELVVPGVVFLASEECSFSGTVLRAADGRFSTVGWHAGEGIDLGREPGGADAVHERWSEIEGKVRVA